MLRANLTRTCDARSQRAERDSVCIGKMCGWVPVARIDQNVEFVRWHPAVEGLKGSIWLQSGRDRPSWAPVPMMMYLAVATGHSGPGGQRWQ